MAAQIDGSWCDVDVHEVIHYTTLNVILDAVHEVPGSHVKDLNEGEVPIKHMERQNGGSKFTEIFTKKKKPRKITVKKAASVVARI